uniref:EPS8 like 3 n=1 Tax=Accipiter nisus TaxID=211598 RepID=A0A8B9NFY0_9AVES
MSRSCPRPLTLCAPADQRKDYGQILLKPQSDFQHHVEVGDTQNCPKPPNLVLEAQGRVWGQDLILQVKDQELMLRDVESKEELEAYPLGSVQGCSAVLDICGYSSVLAISVQEQSPPGTSVLLFHCERLGVSPEGGQGGGRHPRMGGLMMVGLCQADILKSSLEKLTPPLTPSPQTPPPPHTPSPGSGPPQLSPPHPSLPRSSLDTPPPCWHPPGPILLPQEVLNHVLSDLELFVVRLKTALGLVSTTNTKKKKMKKKGGDDYTDFFQKVKYALNLVVGPVGLDATPWPVGIPGLSLPQVLDHCPSPSLALAVEAPLLVPETVELLEKTLHQNNYSTWKSLGMAWNKSRWGPAPPTPNFPKSFSTPTPLSAPCTVTCHQPEGQSWPSVSAPAAPRMLRVGAGFGPWLDAYGPPHISREPLPAQGLVRALYEFQGRNPQELSIRMGDTLQVLDQQKKWWLVQDSQGQKGYVPGNILEPLEHGHGGSPPNLRPNSSPAEVTAWLKDKGFSRITVRCLGVLTGHQLLQMSPTELQAICPEEWRRVLFKLSSVKMSLGVRVPQSCAPSPPRRSPNTHPTFHPSPSLQMGPRD